MNCLMLNSLPSEQVPSTVIVITMGAFISLYLLWNFMDILAEIEGHGEFNLGWSKRYTIGHFWAGPSSYLYIAMIIFLTTSLVVYIYVYCNRIARSWKSAMQWVGNKICRRQTGLLKESQMWTCGIMLILVIAFLIVVIIMDLSYQYYSGIHISPSGPATTTSVEPTSFPGIGVK